MKRSEIESIRIDFLADLFQEYGIIATVEQIEKIAIRFSEGLEEESDSRFNQHISFSEPVCKKCLALESELNKFKGFQRAREEQVRFRTGAKMVWTEENGSITVRH